MNDTTGRGNHQAVHWGFVGTGRIAQRMAEVIRTAPSAGLAAIASRRMETANSFAARNTVDQAFDAWQDLLAWDGVDAIYIATPTSLREEIATAAARAGKHVLAEKPFASLASLQRITAACREHGVVFMDATHFVHHPRYALVRRDSGKLVGPPQSLDSRFLVNLTDRTDIRYDPELEPLGAIGDLGWYNMRATREYLAPDAVLQAASTQLQRDDATGALVAGRGTLSFDNGTTASWQCRFDADQVDISLKLSGANGVLEMDNFIGEEANHSAGFRSGGARGRNDDRRNVSVPSRLSGAALMFEDFAAIVREPAAREYWMQRSEGTQALLDRALAAADSS